MNYKYFKTNFLEMDGLSGCWYYNILSKKTIESGGRYTKTRLLNVLFE